MLKCFLAGAEAEGGSETASPSQELRKIGTLVTVQQSSEVRSSLFVKKGFFEGHVGFLELGFGCTEKAKAGPRQLAFGDIGFVIDLNGHCGLHVTGEV